MSIMSLGLSGLEKGPIPTSARFPSSALPPLNPRFSSMDARLVAAARLPGLSVYGSPYASSNFSGYLPYAPAAAAVAAAAADPSAFYPSLGPGENADSWRASLSQAAAAAYYDPGMAAHYGYGYGPMGLSDGARRKNATRETTSTLKAWLNEHRKNPYPTKGEKIMLAIITKMTLTQVSTWFANARRRLKKENKMTWSPRNRCGEDDDDDDMVDEDHHTNENPSSRLSTPISQDLPPNGRISAHHLDRSFLNGHSSGVESNSDEGMNYSDVRSEGLKPRSDGQKTDSKSPPGSGLHQTNFDEARSRLSASHLSRQHSYPYTSASSPSSLTSTTSISSSIPRPNLSFPQPLPQLVPSHPNMMHAGLTEPLTHPSSLNRLPPHLMAALIEQFHYQQAMHGLPVNSFLNSNAEVSKSSTNAISSTTDSLGSSKNSGSNNPSPTTTSKPSSSVASPTKSKIWSIADVAISNDTSKNAVKTKTNEENVRPPQDNNGSNEIPSVRMWMDVLQHKIAASMSGPINQQQMPQLSNCLNPNSSAPLLAQGCFPPFPNFSGSVHSRDNLSAAAKEIEKCSQNLSEKSSLPPDNTSPVSKETNVSEKNTKNMCESPSIPYHGDSSIEGSDAK